MLTIRLPHCYGVTTSAEVKTLDEASKVLRHEITHYNLGASDTLPGFGDVYARGSDGGAALLARVSYNGRIWTPLGVEVSPALAASICGFDEVSLEAFMQAARGAQQPPGDARFVDSTPDPRAPSHVRHVKRGGSVTSDPNRGINSDAEEAQAFLHALWLALSSQDADTLLASLMPGVGGRRWREGGPQAIVDALNLVLGTVSPDVREGKFSDTLGLEASGAQLNPKFEPVAGRQVTCSWTVLPSLVALRDAARAMVNAHHAKATGSEDLETALRPFGRRS